MIKKSCNLFGYKISLSGGDRTRTCDLWVMSPTSYHCSTPRCHFRGAKLQSIIEVTNNLNHFLLLIKVKSTYTQAIIDHIIRYIFSKNQFIARYE